MVVAKRLAVVILFLGIAACDDDTALPPASTLPVTSVTDSLPGSSTTAAPESTSTQPEWVPVMPTAVAPLSLDAVPRLIPEPVVPGGPLQVRPTDDGPASESTTYVEVYGARTSPAWLHVETSAPGTSAVDGDHIGPWTAVPKSSDGSDSILELHSPNVTVTLWSDVVDLEQMRDIAARLRPGTTSLWDLGDLPYDLELVGGSSASSWVAQRLTQTDPDRGFVLALEVLPDGAINASTYGGQDVKVVDLDGRRAIYYEQAWSDGQVSTLVWEVEPRVFARLGLLDSSPDAMIEAARRVRVVTDDEWNALPRVAGSGDGCPSFWC